MSEPLRPNATTTLPLSSLAELLPLKEAVDRWASNATPVGLLFARIDDDKRADAASALTELLASAVRTINRDAQCIQVPGGVAAAIPGIARPALLQLANEKRQAFATKAGCTTSVGIALGASEGGERLLNLSERGLLRAQRFGGNQVAEAPRLLVVVGGLSPLMHATKGVLARLDLEVQHHQSPEDTIEMLSHERPSIAVVNLLGPRHLLDQIALLQKRPEHAAMQVVLVTTKGPDASYEAIAARVPGATLIQGEVRLVPRVIEAVSQLLGIRPRRHLRVDPAANVQVTVIEADGGAGTTAVGRLVDISESGAKIAVELNLAADQAISLAFKLEHQMLSVQAEVARRYASAEGQREYGIRFEELSTDASRAISEFVLADLKSLPPKQGPLALQVEPEPEVLHEEPVRASVRVRLPKPLTLKARLTAKPAKRVTYLKLVDISEGGFMLVAPRKVNPPFSVGDVLDAFIFGDDTSLHCTAEVVRKSKPELDSNWTLGLRFVTLTRAARTAHARALYRLRG